MLVNFFITGKRKNSTYKPTAADMETGVQLNCKLKDFCSFLNPVLEIQTERQIADYNYFYIPEFDRYYWVDDISWQRGFVAVSGHVDPMASFSQTIKANSAYIVRAAADYDGDIIDTKYPSKSKPDVTTVSIGSDFVGYDPTNGTYVLGVAGGSGAESAVEYYAISPGGFSNVLRALFSDLYFEDIDDSTKEILRTAVNPFQFFTSCMWFPIEASRLGGIWGDVTVGFYNTHISGRKLSSKSFTMHDAFGIPAHPLAAERGEYLNRSPFTKCTLYMPPVGTIPIDTTHSGSAVNVVLEVDLIGGRCLCTVYSAQGGTHEPGGHILAQTSGQIGVPVQLAGTSGTPMGALMTTLTNPNSAAGQTSIGKAIIGGLLGIGDVFGFKLPQLVTSGTNGSRIGITNTYQAVIEHYIPVDDDPAHVGRPLCTPGVVGNYPGYVVTEGFHLSGSNATDAERSIIEGYFNGEGAFIE